MAFHYLNPAELQELITAALNSGLILKPRHLLFDFIDPGYSATLNVGMAPLDQFRSDLGSLNRVERLEDNSVPLVQYLENGAALIGPLPEAKVFKKYQNQVQNNSIGATAIVAAAQSAAVLVNQAIIHQDDTVSPQFILDCVRTAKSVAKLVVPRFDGGQQKMDNNKPWLFYGTGWLIAPDLIITNHHVVNSRSGEERAEKADFERQGRETIVQFDFDAETGAQLDERTVERVEAYDAGLDYCLLRLKGTCGRDPLPLRRAATVISAASYLPLNVIQHPNGKSKRIALRNNLAVAADDTLVKYYTDTDFGSSGAPVLDDEWKVRALHRGALFSQANFQGKDTAYVNVGSQIGRVLDHLKTVNPVVYAEI